MNVWPFRLRTSAYTDFLLVSGTVVALVLRLSRRAEGVHAHSWPPRAAVVDPLRTTDCVSVANRFVVDAGTVLLIEDETKREKGMKCHETSFSNAGRSVRAGSKSKARPNTKGMNGGQEISQPENKRGRRVSVLVHL